MNKIKQFFISKQFRIFLISLASFVFVCAIAFGVYSLSYQDRIFYDVKIGQASFGGLTKDQAKEKLTDLVKNISDQDLTLSYDGQQQKISAKDMQISYDIDKTVENLFSYGRTGNILDRFNQRLSILWNGKKSIAVFSYNKTKTTEILNDLISEVNVLEKDAALKIDNGIITIEKDNFGQELNNAMVYNLFIQEIGYLNDRNIQLVVNVIEPKIYANQLEDVKNQLQNIISQKIVLESANRDFEYGSDKIFKWFDVVAVTKNQISKKNVVRAAENPYRPKLILNQEQIKIDIGNISGQISKDAIDAKLTIVNGQASVFVSSQDGYKLDIDKTLKLITETLYGRMNVAGISSEGNRSNNSGTEVDLPIETIKPTINNDTINNLGIKELISKGTTSFKKSPANRITNIKVGSSMFNGVLIKPGEEFSTLKTLGDISTTRGFLPELVIKEDSTRPEVGGGLCQVSTTLFRAALNAGLKITERTNHRYRVSYYEPPVGMDATIYDPAPDLKFVNNTSGYILIQTYIKGNDLTFEFYGTKDDRKIEISDPVMYDVSSPASPLYIEDASLAPGVTKQKEKAHNGAKASFHYKVTGTDGKVLQEKTFVSTYVPWRAVYLVGPGGMPNTQPADPVQTQEPQPTSTPTPTPEPTQTTPTPTPTTTTPDPTPTPTPTTT